MSFAPDFTKGNFTPENITLPEDPEKLTETLKSILEAHARFINRKSTGQYEETEVQVNHTFPGADPQSKRNVFRSLVNFGVLPNAASKPVAHNLTGFADITFTAIYASATDPDFAGIPIPYTNVATPADGIQLYVDATNVIITTTTANWIGYTECFVVLEYVKS